MAVSRYFAEYTDHWRVLRSEVEDFNRDLVVPYDYSKILGLYRRAQQYDTYWFKYLENREHLDLYYEDLVADSEGVVNKVFQFIGHDDVVRLDPTAQRVTVKMDYALKDTYLQRLTDTLQGPKLML